MDKVRLLKGLIIFPGLKGKVTFNGKEYESKGSHKKQKGMLKLQLPMRL